MKWWVGKLLNLGSLATIRLTCSGNLWFPSGHRRSRIMINVIIIDLEALEISAELFTSETM